LLDHVALKLDRERIKERENNKRDKGRRLFKGGDYFKYFRQGP